MLWPLCVHGLTNCCCHTHYLFKNICVAARVCPPNRFSEAQLRRLADHAHLSPSLSTDCALLFSLAALFRTPILCFQELADSLCKNRGVGVPLRVLCALLSMPSVFQFFREGSARLSALCVSALSFG